MPLGVSIEYVEMVVLPDQLYIHAENCMGEGAVQQVHKDINGTHTFYGWMIDTKIPPPQIQ